MHILHISKYYFPYLGGVEGIFKDFAVMDTEKCFKKYFPITIRHRLEKQVRVCSARLGIYQTMKRIFLIVNKGKAIKR
jgi:hypothetical protein